MLHQEFKKNTPFEKRKEVSGRILARHPDRVPVIVCKATGKNTKNVPEIAKQKFLVPVDISVAKFIHEIRKNLPSLSEEQAIFIFVDEGIMPPASMLMNTLYDRFKDEDGFIYIVYSNEEVFGC